MLSSSAIEKIEKSRRNHGADAMRVTVAAELRLAAAT